MASPISRSVSRFQRAAVAMLKIKQKDALAERYEPLLREFFREYERMFMFRLWSIAQIREPTLADVNEVLSSVEFDTTPMLQKLILHMERDALMQGAKQAHDQFRPRMMAEPNVDRRGVIFGASFTLENKRARDYFKQTGGSTSYIKGIQKTTSDQIKTLITTALDEGWSYSQIAPEVRKLFDEQITPKRSKLIAVTETAAAYEAGNRAFAQSIEDAGTKMEKIWTTSHDGKVSEGCAQNESEGWVPLDFVYEPEGVEEPPRFPGCRCYMQYREA